MEGTSLAGRIAVVTGGAGGIGRAICADLVALEAKVIVADLDEAAAEATAKAMNESALQAGRVAPGAEPATAERVDLADPDDVQAFAANVGEVDVLVHNAGVSIVAPFLDSDPGDWELMWRVNLRAPMLLTKALLPGMYERGWGRLIFISSDGARAGSGGEGAYAATKAGLFGLAKTLAREGARAGVTSNVVCPGPTNTPMVRRVAQQHPDLLDKLAKQIPLRRIGRPDDIAGLVAFLCTDRASYITGQTLSVSGGITMQ